MKGKRYLRHTAKALFAAFKRSYGVPSKVISDDDPREIAADILVIPPTEGRPYYTLLTFGMGARKMNVPPELKGQRLERAELVMHLPAEWKLDGKSLEEPCNSWPVTLLRRVAHLPFREGNFLGWGHSVEIDDPPRDHLFVGAMLVSPGLAGEEPSVRAGGKTVNVYELTPLYIEELGYKRETDAHALYRRLRGVSPILDPRRLNVCDRDVVAPLDDGSWYVWKIHYKRLDTDEKNAYNHLAAYFEWALARGFVRAPYAVIDGDFRTHVMEKLGGRLMLDYFDGEGAQFTEAYFSENGAPNYLSDLSALAEELLGSERARREKGEGYLFLPYSEEYRARIVAILDGRFEEWIKGSS